MSSLSRSAPSELYVGLMSGTSLDGVNAVLADLRRTPRLLEARFVPYPSRLRSALLALAEPAGDELHRAAVLGAELAELYATAVDRLLGKAGGPRRRIRAIGCHGQTVRHRPDSSYTIQIGNAALLAERTGIAVVADFRSRDIAAGGQGAPLVPAFHAEYFRHRSRHRVIINLGGIANLTDLPPVGPVSGFDTGPGNILLDAAAHRHSGKDFDRDGALAATGRPVATLLESMLSDPYFRRPPPKSTGRERFGAKWAYKFRAATRAKPEDLQATLAELTARSIGNAVDRFCAGAQEVYLCGGGVHNADLCRRIEQALPGRRVASTATLGLDPDWVEAMAFAWLAQRALKRENGNLPDVTGAAGPRILGAIYPA